MYAYDVSKKYEEIFFSKLYKVTDKKSNKIGEAYIKQVKLVLKQLDDKNNIELRRRIFSKKFCPNALSYAK
jgi:predicted ArsR family transcriptional regulator